MYDLLVSSVENLQKSKYSKGNRRNLGYVLGALRQANTLFKPQSISDNMSSLSFRYVKQEDQIPRILEEFITEFEKELPEATTFNVKIYSHFTILALKITRCISDDKRRGLESAHTLEKMNHLFQRYPIIYTNQARRDPLGLLFAIAELALEVQRNLGASYKFEETTFDQLAPFMQKCYLDYDDVVGTLIDEITIMPKSRISVTLGKEHREIIVRFLQYAISGLQLGLKIKRSEDLLKKIISQEDDTKALGYYEVLKLAFHDRQVCSYISDITKKTKRPSRRFACTILDEISRLG